MLTGKVSIITGASSGIGAALAQSLAREGSTVVLAARRSERLEAVAHAIRQEGGTALPLTADVTNRVHAESVVACTIKEFGRIDVLVNNAGRGHFASVEDTTDAVLETMFAVNVYSLWYMTRPVLRQMKLQGNGHIINVASIAGKIGFPFNSAYVAAKHACVGFTHALRAELMETGIHASVVCPAGVLTDWASSTEGGPILSMFSASGPAIKRIAAERDIELPPIEGVLAADVVAGKILECIYHPVAEVYTHKGSREFATLAARDRETAEHHQLPVVLGERSLYQYLKEHPASR
jgi:hypothetical protein